ncbi:unnamed protein product [Closterium sp. NIES-54]
MPMPFTSARCLKADVTCFTGDGSSSVSNRCLRGHEEELTRKAIVPRIALVASTLHTCSTTSAIATVSTASSSPSSSSSTLLALSRSPSIRELVAIAPHMSALVTIVALAVESAATASVALVVAAVSATPAASIEVVAAKSASPSSSAPSTAMPYPQPMLAAPAPSALANSRRWKSS